MDVLCRVSARTYYNILQKEALSRRFQIYNYLVYFDYFESPSTFMSDISSFENNMYSNFYNIDFLYDNKSGFLFKKFQSMNNQLINEIKISAFNEIESSYEINELKEKILFIPYEVYCWYDVLVLRDKKNGFNKLKKDYNFQYAVLSSEDISNKILNNDEFYYLKFNLIETDKVLQVVSRKSGKIIYSKRFSGMVQQLPNKAIKDLNNEIEKSSN